MIAKNIRARIEKVSRGEKMVALLPRVILTLTVLLLVACGSTGKDFDPALTENIVNGKTTREEIRSMFGEPYKTGIQNGDPIWAYEYHEYGLSENNPSRQLIVVFGPDDVVKSHQKLFTGTQ
ncbi:MAG: outer membrane protein assembly factor BamE [Nitrospinae bacterium]|nr:outer membrane protein assembly factor BamE [Nitrospinota bacterium]